MTSVLLGLWMLAFAADPISVRSASNVSYIGRATWPGTARDRSALTETLEDGSVHNRLGGLGSGIAWTGVGDQFLMIPDRGAGDGAVSYRCRFHRVAVRIDPTQSTPVTWELEATKLLTGPTGVPLIGLASASPHVIPGKPLRFDPEAIRVTSENTVLVAEEYGPSIIEFDISGKWLRQWTLPDGFTISHPAATPMEELPPHHQRGRQPNRGVEGLAITPDGKTIVLLMQGPLLQDGALDPAGNRSGRIVRLVTIERATGDTAQYAYRLESPAHGLNEIEALNQHEFLVIERDGRAGANAAFKRIARIDLRNATRLDSDVVFAQGELPEAVRAVAKSWLIDLLDPQWKLAGENFPEKTEGLALGPTLPDGRRCLLITSDNDFQPDVPTCVDVFGVLENDLR